MQTSLVEIQFLVKDLKEIQYTRLDEASDLSNELEIRRYVTIEIELMMVWFEYLEYCLFFLSTLLIQPVLEFIGQLSLKKKFDWYKLPYILDVVAVSTLVFYFNQTYLILSKTR